MPKKRKKTGLYLKAGLIKSFLNQCRLKLVTLPFILPFMLPFIVPLSQIQKEFQFMAVKIDSMYC